MQEDTVHIQFCWITLQGSQNCEGATPHCVTIYKLQLPPTTQKITLQLCPVMRLGNQAMQL